MFSMLDAASHMARRRIISSVYAKSNLISGPSSVTRSTNEIIGRDLVKHISEQARSGTVVGIVQLYARMMVDATSAFIFGMDGRSNYLHDETAWKLLAKSFGDRSQGVFLPQELPVLNNLAQRLGFKSGTGLDLVDAWCLDKCRDVEARAIAGQLEEGEASVWRSLDNAIARSKKDLDRDMRRRLVASEIMDHIVAAFDTSSIALNYSTYQLSRPCNRHIQDALREELRSLHGQDKDGQENSLPPLKSLDGLPLLSAILMETLRLHQPVPGPQPRVSHAGATLEGVGTLPSGVQVSANALCLHRNEDVFPNPNEWTPHRWMKEGAKDDERLKEMNRWFWAFGSGGRMCIGNHFAILHMKAALAAIYSRFATEIVDDSGIEQLE
ncbi:hypothetical protein JX265_011610 [Neoarthrinium moseri]|uniref:Cytochrome P450 n=1 Tax=Neoarthrinium moseri TaxID=1658444 RepID=A0A9P9WBW9_9PEZI|nr:hypothetical protein JX265_011610 [Neoarthrinium moseri]